jgi:hypothetical protein
MKFFFVKSTGIAICAGLSMTMSINGYAFEISYLSSTWQNEKIDKHPDIVSAFRIQPPLLQENTGSVFSNKLYRDRWLTLIRDRGEKSAKLRQKQWQVDYLNTSGYLLALQERVEGVYAGGELQTQFKLYKAQWLLKVGQISIATK